MLSPAKHITLVIFLLLCSWYGNAQRTIRWDDPDLDSNDYKLIGLAVDRIMGPDSNYREKYLDGFHAGLHWEAIEKNPALMHAVDSMDSVYRVIPLKIYMSGETIVITENSRQGVHELLRKWPSGFDSTFRPIVQQLIERDGKTRYNVNRVKSAYQYQIVESTKRDVNEYDEIAIFSVSQPMMNKERDKCCMYLEFSNPIYINAKPRIVCMMRHDHIWVVTKVTPIF